MNSISYRLCRWFLTLFAVSTPATAFAQVAPTHPVPWKVAVVFARREGQRIYAGTLYKPVLTPSLERLSRLMVIQPGVTLNAERIAFAAAVPLDYEVWLVADGITTALGYASRRSQVAILGQSRAYSLGRADTEVLKRIVNSARPVAKRSRSKRTLSGSYPSLPLIHLKLMCQEAHAIVVGRVVGILREAPTPINYIKSDLQHTVYLVAVESHLKISPLGPLAVIKIRQVGGQLNLRPDAPPHPVLGDPHLALGNRYILFLNAALLRPEGRTFLNLGYVPATVDGVTGKGAELDEFILLHPWNGQVLLQNGITQTPLEDGGERHWRFSEGPQILDVPEKEAIDSIRRQLLTRL